MPRRPAPGGDPPPPWDSPERSIAPAARREELRPVLAQLRRERAAAAVLAAEDAEWERFLSCPHLPDPRNARQARPP